MKIKDIIPVALGETLPDVLLKNLKLVNVFTGKIEETNIALCKKRIAGIGDYHEGKEVIDLHGMYVLPGFIDAHLHIESSMLSPRQFAKIIIPHGTTTLIADPHEITNVLGLEGLEYMIKSTEGIPMNIYIAIPSAVPATHLETSGARLGPEDIVGFVDDYPDRIIGLGEVMNFPGVLNRDFELLTKIEILRHKYKKIDGHCPGLTGKQLNAYINAFIRSDHECTTKEEALEKISKGMHVFIREGTAAKNLDELIKAVDINNHMCFSFCTDDREPHEIIDEGHIDYHVRRSIQLGIDPIIAIRMATINTARHFNLRSMGAIAPGYKADMLVVDDLKKMNINMVIKDSRIVSKNGEMIEPIEGIYNNLPGYLGKIKLPDLNKDSFLIKDRNKKIRVIKMTEGSLLTEEMIVEPKVENGFIVSDTERDIVKVVIIERHKGSGFSSGFVSGLGIKNGAIGMSIGHDSHNIGIAGTNDEDIYMAAKEIAEINGGIVIVKEGKIISRLPLSIAGLMSDKNPNEVIKEIHIQEKALKEIGCEKNVIMTLSFIQLPVIPDIKITDLGIIDVKNQKVTDLFCM